MKKIRFLGRYSEVLKMFRAKERVKDEINMKKPYECQIKKRNVYQQQDWIFSKQLLS